MSNKSSTSEINQEKENLPFLSGKRSEKTILTYKSRNRKPLDNLTNKPSQKQQKSKIKIYRVKKLSVDSGPFDNPFESDSPLKNKNIFSPASLHLNAELHESSEDELVVGKGTFANLK
jgi:hypothetical protein